MNHKVNMPRVYQPEMPRGIGGLHDSLMWFLKNQLSGRKVIINCASISHSKNVSAALNGSGIKAMHVDAKMDRIDRADRLSALSSGQVQCLAHCATLLDSPLVSADACIMMAPTGSKMRALAQIKMVMGAADPVVVDMVGNFNRLSLFAELDRIISRNSRCVP